MFLHAASILIAAGDVAGPSPLYDPTRLNIGLSCRWEAQCMQRQSRAMRNALKYVSKIRPDTWRIQQCNRNASRRYSRVDWVGFNNCIRNPGLEYRPVRRVPLGIKRNRRR